MTLFSRGGPGAVPRARFLETENLKPESPLIRALGIDHGEARIGLAISDDLGMLAHPLETVHLKETPDPLARIAAVVRERAIDTIVIGLPLRMDGTEGTATGKVRAFIGKLQPLLPEDTVVITLDERLSTVVAQEHLHASGRNVKQGRPVIDQAAACVILQDYLDSRSAAGLHGHTQEGPEP